MRREQGVALPKHAKRQIYCGSELMAMDVRGERANTVIKTVRPTHQPNGEKHVEAAQFRLCQVERDGGMK